MLTMLDLWARVPSREDPSREEVEEWEKAIPGVKHLGPILDFDPLPQALPLHAWLLEPWKRWAKYLDEKACKGDESLVEKHRELSEGAIQGWSKDPRDPSAIARTLAVEEQLMSFVDLRKTWGRFVDDVICTDRGHQKPTAADERAKCTQKHDLLYVIAIDDVDLEVERQAQLLHALRLLHHPNVLYLLTGNYAHTHFVTLLDFEANHMRLMPYALNGRAVDLKARSNIRQHSRRLRDSLLEKVLAAHARIDLRELTCGEALSFKNDQWAGYDVRRALGPLAAFLDDAKDLSLATARKIQYACDAVGPSPAEGDHKAQRALFAALCGAPDVEEPERPEPPRARVTLRGVVSTRLGSERRRWSGATITTVLAERPALTFDRFQRGARDPHPSPTGAFLLWRAAEGNPTEIEAPGLEWRPNAGVLATEVTWKGGGKATFHWPWLLRPSTTAFLKFHALVKMLDEATRDSVSLYELESKLIVPWIDWNLQQWREQRVKGAPVLSRPSENVAEALRNVNDLLNSEAVKANVHDRREVVRFQMELFLMAAHYIGLQPEIAGEFHAELHKSATEGSGSSRGKIEVEERLAIKNAIRDARPKLTVDQVEKAVGEFYVSARDLAYAEQWWAWSKGSLEPTIKPSR